MAKNKVGHALASAGLVTDIDTAQRNPLGAVMQTDDGGEYIYLGGCASLVANDWVFYDETFTAIRMVSSSVNGPVAIAAAAVLATQFGWFCIKSPSVTGNCISDTFADDSQVFVTSTAGSVDDDTGAGLTVYNAISRAQGSGTTNTFQIVYPFVLGSAPA